MISFFVQGVAIHGLGIHRYFSFSFNIDSVESSSAIFILGFRILSLFVSNSLILILIQTLVNLNL